MNIYKTTKLGTQEITISIEIDSENKADIELAKELIGIGSEKSEKVEVFIPKTITGTIDDVLKELNKSITFKPKQD